MCPADECIFDTKITLAASSQQALTHISNTLEGLGWNIVERCRDGLTGELLEHGQHSIVVTSVPAGEAVAELLVTLCSSQEVEQLTVHAINALNGITLLESQ